MSKLKESTFVCCERVMNYLLLDFISCNKTRDYSDEQGAGNSSVEASVSIPESFKTCRGRADYY